MSDSLDSADKASIFGKNRKKNKKENDTPETREARIQMYMARANVDPSAKEPTPRRGSNNRPINIFTGIEYTEEEMKVEGDINED